MSKKDVSLADSPTLKDCSHLRTAVETVHTMKDLLSEQYTLEPLEQKRQRGDRKHCR